MLLQNAYISQCRTSEKDNTLHLEVNNLIADKIKLLTCSYLLARLAMIKVQ